MRTLALYNLKGGVGKTVSAVNLAALAARAGFKTLLWDLDPQGSAAWYLGLDREATGGMKRLARGRTPIGELIRHSPVPGLDVLAGGLSSLHLETAQAGQHALLTQLADPLAEDYHLLVYDCPAGLQAVNEAVLESADVVAVPMIPTSLSLNTYELLVHYLAKHKLTRVKLYPFLSQVDRRRGLHRTLCETLPSRMRTLLRARIPYASVVEQMGPKRLPLALFAPHSPAAHAYAELWAELGARLKLEAPIAPPT